MRPASSIGLLVLALGSPVQGQEVAEQEFLAGLTKDHSAVRALGEDLARAEAARVRAGTLLNPRVELWQERPEANPRVSNWTLAWTPPLDGRYGLARRAADVGVDAARERLAADQARVRAEARRVFAEWALGMERAEILRDQLQRVDLLSRRESARARSGEESGLSARRLALAASEARGASGVAEADRLRAEASVRAWRSDLPSGARPARAVLPEPPAETVPVDSPELRALQREADRARLEQRLSRRFLGFPELQLGWQRLEQGGVSQTGPILAVAWSVPVLDRGQAGRLEAARRHEVAAARVELAAARLRSEIEGRTAAYRTLHAASRDADAQAGEADRAIDAASAAFQAAEATLTDLLETLRSGFSARLRAVELRERALEAHRELELALGRPL